MNRRALVIGSGERAERLRREASRPLGAFHVVGLVDPGEILNLPELALKLRAEFALIALDTATRTEIRAVVDACITAGLEFSMLPWDSELRAGVASLDQLRAVRIEDWLAGPPLDVSLEMVGADLVNRVVLLTGAAGSIGSELARRIASFKPARLILLDQAETDLYFLQLDLQPASPDIELVPVVCDVTIESRLAQVFAQHRPDYVIHAAAYKHVSLMETNVLEAVRNNVLGTLVTATMAVRYGATKVLLISTDKAIRPTSVMGATKRLAERLVFGLPNLHRFGTDFRAVRFGNVLASRGSVVPLFERQLAGGGPITVTHPLAERYFMTIPDAAQLVLQVGALPEAAGSIAMVDMGAPVRIVDLADRLIRFSGRVPSRDVSITFTGLRPGEKLTEDLESAMEASIPTSNNRIRISQTEPEGPELLEGLIRLLACVESGNRNGVLTTLCELVPECVAPLRKFEPTELGFDPSRSTAPVLSGWGTLVQSLHQGWRERRRPAAPDPEPEGRLLDRRQGVACRRKAARSGGRRRTDVVEPLQLRQMVASR